MKMRAREIRRQGFVRQGVRRGGAGGHRHGGCAETGEGSAWREGIACR